MNDRPHRPALWMFLGAFSFAVMAAITSVLGARCDWLVIAGIRAGLMFVCALLLARSVGIPLVVWNPPTLWLRSLAGSLSLVCSFFALTRLPVANALTLANTYPLWIVLLTALHIRRCPSAPELLGVISGLIGVVLIQRPSLHGNGLAALVALVGSVSTALAMLGLHRLKGVDTLAVMAHFSGVASFFAGSWLALRWGSTVPWRFEPVTLVMLLAVGLTGTVGQFFLTKAYAAGVPTRVSVISLTQVPFAMVFDMAVSGRALTSLALLGTCLVLAPAAWLASSSREFTRSDGGFFPSLALRAYVMITARPQHKSEAQAREPYRGRGTEAIDTDGGFADTL